MILRNDSHSVIHGLRVLQSPCYDIPGCDWFLVDLDPDLAWRLLERAWLFAAAQAKDESIIEAVFTDASGRFVGDIDPLGEFDGAGQPESCFLVVRQGEVLWRAVHPDYDLELETEPLSVEELRDVAGRALVRIG
jgi:hypothetical protein